MTLDQQTFWTTRFRDLPQEDRWARLEASQDLLNQIDWYRGDPRLTAWQESFLVGLKAILIETRGMARISPKQWAQLRKIQDLADGIQDDRGAFSDEMDDTMAQEQDH